MPSQPKRWMLLIAIVLLILPTAASSERPEPPVELPLSNRVSVLSILDQSELDFLAGEAVEQFRLGRIDESLHAFERLGIDRPRDMPLGLLFSSAALASGWTATVIPAPAHYNLFQRFDEYRQQRAGSLNEAIAAGTVAAIRGWARNGKSEFNEFWNRDLAYYSSAPLQYGRMIKSERVAALSWSRWYSARLNDPAGLPSYLSQVQAPLPEPVIRETIYEDWEKAVLAELLPKALAGLRERQLKQLRGMIYSLTGSIEPEKTSAKPEEARNRAASALQAIPDPYRLPGRFPAERTASGYRIDLAFTQLDLFCLSDGLMIVDTNHPDQAPLGRITLADLMSAGPDRRDGALERVESDCGSYRLPANPTDPGPLQLTGVLPNGDSVQLGPENIVALYQGTVDADGLKIEEPLATAQARFAYRDPKSEYYGTGILDPAAPNIIRLKPVPPLEKPATLPALAGALEDQYRLLAAGVLDYSRFQQRLAALLNPASNAGAAEFPGEEAKTELAAKLRQRIVSEARRLDDGYLQTESLYSNRWHTLSNAVKPHIESMLSLDFQVAIDLQNDPDAAIQSKLKQKLAAFDQYLTYHQMIARVFPDLEQVYREYLTYLEGERVKNGEMLRVLADDGRRLGRSFGRFKAEYLRIKSLIDPSSPSHPDRIRREMDQQRASAVQFMEQRRKLAGAVLEKLKYFNRLNQEYIVRHSAGLKNYRALGPAVLEHDKPRLHQFIEAVYQFLISARDNDPERSLAWKKTYLALSPWSYPALNRINQAFGCVPFTDQELLNWDDDRMLPPLLDGVNRLLISVEYLTRNPYCQKIIRLYEDPAILSLLANTSDEPWSVNYRPDYAIARIQRQATPSIFNPWFADYQSGYLGDEAGKDRERIFYIADSIIRNQDPHFLAPVLTEQTAPGESAGVEPFARFIVESRLRFDQPGSFRPDQALTRAGLCEMAATLFAMPPRYGENRWADLDDFSKEGPWVLAVAGLDLAPDWTKGVRFQPQAQVSRIELAQFLLRLISSKGPLPEVRVKTIPPDLGQSPAVKPILTLIGSGIMPVDPKNRFQPNRVVLRAEAAAALIRSKEFIEKKR